MTLGSRRFSKQSVKSIKSGFGDQPDGPAPADEAAAQHPTSRLKRVSDATVRRISFPFSLISSRPSSAAVEKSDMSKTSTRHSFSSRASRSKKKPPSSRIPSMASARRPQASKGPVAVSGGDLGALPVFGISQRGYLASLVSLFSEGNGQDQNSSHLATPVSTNTAITDPDPSINGRKLGPYEYETSSTAIFRFSKARRMYVGWPSIVHPPPEALLEFEMETLPLMERDLHAISAYLGQQGIRITYELRMSGRAGPGADTVTLSPTIWILHRSYAPAGARLPIAELHRAVAEIFYLNRGVEIQEGGGRTELNSDRPLVGVKRDERDVINLSDGGKLSVHMEDCQDKYSVCGARCCVTIQGDSSQVQSLSRIGGLLKVNGKYVLGVSTAHAMLDSSAVFQGSFDEPPRGQAVDRDAVSAEAGDVSRWHNVTRDAAVDFLGISMNSRGEMAINRSKPENATDFSLLRLRGLPRRARNQYAAPRSAGGRAVVSITSAASAGASSLDEGPVYVLCGGDDVVDGRLVWGTACFVVRGRNFRVRRIQTTRPLNAGVSGAWVVRGEVLYGVIIAVYEDEPFALMMTAERLFASILGSAFSIRSVELWDGELPDILKAYHAGPGDGTGSKDVVRVEMQPRPAQKPEECPHLDADADMLQALREASGSSAKPALEVEPEDAQTTAQDERRRIEGKKSEAVHTDVVPCPSPPETAGCGTQTEPASSPPPTGDWEQDGDDLVVAHDAASSSSGSNSRPSVHSRTVSKASDVTMSGAVQTPPDEDLLASAESQSTEGGCDSSSAAETYFTPRQSTFSPEQVRVSGLDAGIIADRPPSSTCSKRGKKLRGGGSEGTNTAIPRGGRRNSLQPALSRAFHDSSSRDPAENSMENGHALAPATDLNGRTPLSNRRRSLPVEPLRNADDSGRRSNHSVPAEGLNNKKSFFRRRPASTQSSALETPTSTRDNSFGAHPGGLDKRPNVLRRLSSGRPFSYGLSRDKERFSKDNNFGIPPRGL